jgi:hypothetical protein
VLLRPANRSTICTFESHRETAEIYYITEGGKDEQIEGVKV